MKSLRMDMVLPMQEDALVFIAANGFELVKQEDLMVQYRKGNVELTIDNIFGLVVKENGRCIMFFNIVGMDDESILIILHLYKIVDIKILRPEAVIEKISFHNNQFKIPA